jgi:hypothetical protein
MFKVFRRLDFETFKKLYKVYIRPLLEYANVIWSPHLQRDIDTLERIQINESLDLDRFHTQLDCKR